MTLTSAVVFDHCHDYLSRYLIFTIPILLMNNFTLYMIAAREFLERAEQEGRVISVCDDLPRSFVLVGEEKGTATVYISQLSSAALLRRAESNLL